MLVFFTLMGLLVSHADTRIMLPVEILNVLQEEYAAESSVKPVVEEIQVTIERDKSVRDKKSQTITLGKDQDTLDLANYIPNNTHHFNLSFKTKFEVSEQTTKLFFINRYQMNDKHATHGGMACGQAVKIQKQIGKLFTTQGVKFMTHEGSYLNLLGGDFLLTHLDKQQLQVVYFKVIDGRYSIRLCR